MLVTEPPAEEDLGPLMEEASDLDSEEMDELQAALDAASVMGEESVNSEQLEQLETALEELEVAN